MWLLSRKLSVHDERERALRLALLIEKIRSTEFLNLNQLSLPFSLSLILFLT